MEGAEGGDDGDHDDADGDRVDDVDDAVSEAMAVPRRAHILYRRASAVDRARPLMSVGGCRTAWS